MLPISPQWIGEVLLAIFSAQWIREVLLTMFSAFSGAAALLFLQSLWRRARFLRALQTELEQNLTRIEEKIGRLKYEDNRQWNAQFRPMYLDVYEQIRLDEPTLFLTLHAEIPHLDIVYQKISSYDQASQPGISKAIDDKQVLIADLEDLVDSLERVLSEVENLRENHPFYRYIGNRGTLRRSFIWWGEEPEEDPESSSSPD